MKKSLAFVLGWCVSVVLTTGFAAPPPLSLFSFAVFASDSIVSQKSDYLGLVGAQNTIQLIDFRVQPFNRANGTCCQLGSYAVFAGDSVSFSRGAIYRMDGSSKVAMGAMAARIAMTDVAAGASSYQSARLNAVSDEMIATSETVAKLPINGTKQIAGNEMRLNGLGFGSTTIFQIDAADLASVDQITLVGYGTQTLVINVTGAQVDLSHKNFALVGDLRFERILFNFPQATDLMIYQSGSSRLPDGSFTDIPGTFLAPYAIVRFNEATINGSLFAKIVASGLADPSVASHGGQVNGQCFSSSALNIGCCR